MVLRIKVFDFSWGFSESKFFDFSGGRSKIKVFDFSVVDLKSGFLILVGGFSESRCLIVVGVNLLNLGF